MNSAATFGDVMRKIDPGIPTELLALMLLLGVIVMFWDILDRRSKQIRKTSGLGEKSEILALQGSASLPSKEYSSETLSSRPHGLLREDRAIIPVDVYPMSKKVRDRHVAQMLVHLRLIEEIEKVHPPYGVLVMGKEARSVRIKNTPEKQRWLDTILDEMRSIASGVPAIPSPTFYKCRSCDVREICAHSAYHEREGEKVKDSSSQDFE